MKYKEITSACRTFQLGDEPELIHVHKVRDNEYLILHEDAYGLHTGKVHYMTEAELEGTYGRILTPFKIGDKVALTDETWESYFFTGENEGFYIKDILAKDYPYNIVVGNTRFGKDWGEFFSEDELILIEEWYMNMKTAREFAIGNFMDVESGFSFELGGLHKVDQQQVIRIMIDFAKMHVQEALKQASLTVHNHIVNDLLIRVSNIINSYPLTNIK